MIERIRVLIVLSLKKIHKQKRLALVLACFVVFATTYVLILPAFTLEAGKAADQGGIDVPKALLAVEDKADSDDPGGSSSGEKSKALSEAKGDSAKAKTDTEGTGKADTSAGISGAANDSSGAGNSGAANNTDNAGSSNNSGAENPDVGNSDAEKSKLDLENGEGADGNSTGDDAAGNSTGDDSADNIDNPDADNPDGSEGENAEASDEGTDAAEDSDAADSKDQPHVLTADGKDYTVTVEYGDDAELPEGVTLEADEIAPDTKAYKECIAKAMEAVNPTEEVSIEFARFFDIRLMYEGEKYEPAAPVKVSVSYKEALELTDENELIAVHFADKGPEVIDAETDKSNKEVTFVQDSFSITGTIVTSDARWPSSNGPYIMYVQQGNDYYAVAHDRTLTPVTISNNQVTFDSHHPINKEDYLWQYESQGYSTPWGQRYRYYVYYNDGSGDTYLDPDSDTGISGDVTTLTRNGSGRIAILIGNSTGPYIGVQDGAIVGNQQQADGVQIQFAQIPRNLTIHFVDRNGNPIEGVKYTGSESLPVTENANGTFYVPYDWGGQNGSIDISTMFSKSGYTYASTHLAGARDGTSMTYDGLTIDHVLTERNGKLYYKSDCGDQYANPRGNLGYGALPDYDFNSALSVPREAVNATTNVGTINYSRSNVDKDVYVILDPKPARSGSSDDDDVNLTDPAFQKKLESNGDGTYTLSLSITGSGKNTKDNPKANVIFIVDTSSSMRKNVSNPNSDSSPTRLEDTRKELAAFSQQLLANNTSGDNSDKIEVAMVRFDGGVVSNGQWYTQYNGNNGFKDQVDALKPSNMHTGTDWEDGLKAAYELGKAKLSEGEATYVVFFTDGEPSQYTNFSGEGEYNGQNRGYRYWYSCFLSREAAKDEARAIVNEGMELYSIFAYNPISDTYAATGENGSDMLHHATQYAYNTTADLNGSRFYHAENTAGLNAAFAGILNSINEYIGITEVEVNDSITSLTSVGITTIGGNYTGFKYTRSGGSYGADGQTWTDAPSATYDANGVHWDLSSLGILEEGVTYKVSFVVWPSQESYDWVADLNNGVRTWADLEAAGLDSHFIRVEDSSTPSGYRYEVATNPPSKDSDGRIINNKITYTKTHRETIGNLPSGVTLGETVTTTDPLTGTKVSVTYTQNTDGTYRRTTVTEAVNAFGPPDLNMDLRDTIFKVQKKWVMHRPEELIAFLYNTSNGQLLDDYKNIDFVINQSSARAPYASSQYKTITLGYIGDDAQGKAMFDWGDETQTITVNGRNYEVGTIWEEPLDIAVGLMLTPAMAAERGIDLADPKYIPVYENEGDAEALYYVLEKGHDYSIDEPDLDYRFDFKSDVYHPMLVDKVLRDVKLKYKTSGGREIAILEEITPEGEKLGALQGENVLRGELTIEKIVLDTEGERDTSDAAKAKVFPLTVTLTNDPGEGKTGPFYNIPNDPSEQNVPWCGVQINGEGEVLYYQKQKADGSFDYYCNEYEACVDGDFTHGLKPGYAGNAMTESADYKTATETIYVSPYDKWTITNIPGGTSYEITEAATAGYAFVKAEELESDPPNLVEAPAAATISGEIHSNTVTNVEFTNQKLIVPINVVIKKTDVLNLNEEDPELLAGAVFRLEKYTSSTFRDLDDEWGDSGTITLTDVDNNGTFSFEGLSAGFYKLVETQMPDGYVKIGEDPLFEVKLDPQTGELKIYLIEKGEEDTYSYVDGNNNGVVKVDNDLSAGSSGSSSSAGNGQGAGSTANGSADAEVLVGNESGAALPHTGGMGTTLFYVLGAILAVGCGVVLAARRRVKA